MKNMISCTGGRSHGAENSIHNRSGEFNNLMNYFWNYFDSANTSLDAANVGELEPRLQIAETDDAVNITAELPGIAEDALDLQISSDGYLSICGEKKNTVKTSDKNTYFSEISYGTFKRTIPLPWDLDYEKATAKYDNGVVCVSIPKSTKEKQKFKKITIQKNFDKQ